MSVFDYKIERFTGLDQSLDEALISPGASPDELNMDTSGGRLSTAAGFAPLFPAALPGAKAIDALSVFHTADKDIFVAISNGTIYACNGVGSWQSIHTYGLSPENPRYCFAPVQIDGQDFLLIANGRDRMLKYDGTEIAEFGSSEGCSDIACAYAVTYRSRLFAAGDEQHPNRLYYSQLPGSGRTVEDWGYVQASPAVEGGHVEIGAAAGDRITGLASLSNQLLIFKKHSLYRLIGDRPGNFTVERISSAASHAANTAFAVCDDAVYYLTEKGICCFNGVDAAPLPDAERISLIMKNADIRGSMMAAVGGRLYALIYTGGAKRLIEYDIRERRYLQFGGFEPYGIMEYEGSLALIASTRRVCIWGRGGDFDGAPIEAHWRTPVTDLGDRAHIKSPQQLYLRGEGKLKVASTVGGVCEEQRVRLTPGVTELPLKNEGRTLCLRFSNEDGNAFSLSGGAQLAMSVRRRTE